jgi:hypothetical protein
MLVTFFNATTVTLTAKLQASNPPAQLSSIDA